MVYVVIYKILDLVFQALYFALLIRVLISWIPHDRHHPIMNFIYSTTDPLLLPFQNIIPTWKLGIDLSPIFAFFAIGIVRNLVFQLLF